MIIAENVAHLKSRIASAASLAGRHPDEIKLLAVTKTHSAAVIEEALSAGIKYIGENRIQEANEKIPLLSGKYKEFHFIGHLQSNKIKKLISLKPALIHSIDSFSTARKLNDYLTLYNLNQEVLIQVNTASEESKFGIKPDEAKDFVSKLSHLSNLKVMGLMTIGKLTTDAEEIRDCFRTLRELFESLKKEAIPYTEMKYLSMGMTSDFEIAIQEGANIVRIGSAIFGAR
jgi:pyridoxal phosphate enzyme, YggS family